MFFNINEIDKCITSILIYKINKIISPTHFMIIIIQAKIKSISIIIIILFIAKIKNSNNACFVDIKIEFYLMDDIKITFFKIRSLLDSNLNNLT